jgi:hypothetical protein
MNVQIRIKSLHPLYSSAAPLDQQIGITETKTQTFTPPIGLTTEKAQNLKS